MSVVYIASRNLHKVDEYRMLLDGMSVLPLPPEVPESPETATSFEGNALEKAVFYGSHVNGWVLADDSGLCVHALDGEPGIFSARYAGVHGDDAANNTKLLSKLSGVPHSERTAEFVCSIALWNSQIGRAYVVRGTVPGRIIDKPRGMNGFGYDPLFYVEEHGATFAELPAAVKNQISHRSRAVASLMEAVGRGNLDTLFGA